LFRKKNLFNEEKRDADLQVSQEAATSVLHCRCITRTTAVTATTTDEEYQHNSQNN
jgi:hypothetical protein